jgi:adenine/guanine/hypoxanthine permease
VSGFLDRYFSLSVRGTTPATEVRAGAATFLTMAYILFVNPQILAEAGMPVEDVTMATALSAAIATLVMGLYANYPFALAPGMGLNAYFTYGVVHGMGVSFQVALTAVLIEGLLFMALAFGGIRTAIINAIPAVLKTATMAGIGLFLAFIGFQNAGIVAESPATLVTLGDIGSAPVALSLVGLLLTSVLLARRVLGSILIGIAAVTLIAWASGLTPVPSRIFALPSFPDETFLAFDFDALFTGKLIAVIIAFLFVDFFDTSGTLMGIGKLGGFLDKQGRLERADEAFTADAAGTIAGACLGTSTVTTYIESATGIEEGGRTGLTAVTVAVLFLLSVFFVPLVIAVPAIATAPALIVVGALMMQGARDIDWARFDVGLPAFLTISAMPFTFSIANGIALGIISFVIVTALVGRAREVHPIMYALAALLTLYYALQPGF